MKKKLGEEIIDLELYDTNIIFHLKTREKKKS